MYFEGYPRHFSLCHVSIVLLLYTMTYIHIMFASGYEISIKSHGSTMYVFMAMIWHFMSWICTVYFGSHVQYLLMTEHGYACLGDVISTYKISAPMSSNTSLCLCLLTPVLTSKLYHNVFWSSSYILTSYIRRNLLLAYFYPQGQCL